jgi:serpin B
MRPFTAFILIFSLAFGLSACHKNVDGPAVSKPLQLPPNSAPVIDASNQFAIKFFAAVMQNDPGTNNKLVSPFSIYSALSMVVNGAAGATRDSIVKTLELNGISLQDLNALNKALLTQLPSEDSKVTMDIANSIWYSKETLQPRPAFLDTIKNDYQGLIQSLDFGNPSSVNTINSWVAKKTKNKIPSIISTINPSEMMFLINTIYFNGAWQYAFNPASTLTSTFRLSNGQTVPVPFMNKEVTIRTSNTPSFTLAELPYGTGKAYDMYLLLPASSQQPIADLTGTIGWSAISEALTKMDSSRISLSMPKWEYAYSIDDMRPHLTQLGMGIAFGHADLSNMYQVSPGALAIGRSIHKTYIKVSEQGTEAAAATVISIVPTASAPGAPLVIDHPFLYFIREKQTGLILFVGMVSDPSKS